MSGVLRYLPKTEVILAREGCAAKRQCSLYRKGRGRPRAEPTMRAGLLRYIAHARGPRNAEEHRRDDRRSVYPTWTALNETRGRDLR